jgi:hypothetical protein
MIENGVVVMAAQQPQALLDAGIWKQVGHLSRALFPRGRATTAGSLDETRSGSTASPQHSTMTTRSP